MMDKEKDIVLIKQIKNGNKKAEETLYKKYSKIIKKYLSNKYSNQIDLDDNVSEILIKIFENINCFDKKKSSFQTWVINIAKNYMIDQSRTQFFKLKYNSGTYTISNDGSINVGFTTENYSNNVTLKNTCYSYTIAQNYELPNVFLETSDSINFISNNTNPNDYHLLTMKYKEGYNYNEMETEMGVSSSTLSNRINYIKTKLKKTKNKGEY